MSCYFYVFIFFFFQAEDGIRDWSVTGVQTCALPISEDEPDRRERREWPRRQASTRREQRDAGRAAHPEETPAHPQEIEDEHRSEERRVGKECRSGGSADQ